MKRSNYVVAFAAMFLMTVVLTSCGSDKKNDEVVNKLGKMEVVIPDELKDNPEMVEYIEGMTEVVDAYALMFDEMIGEMKEYKGKDFDDLNMREKIKFTASAAEIAMKSAPVMVKWAEYEIDRSTFNDELTEEELIALESVWLRFEQRMEQIEERHSEFFDGEAEEE